MASAPWDTDVRTEQAERSERRRPSTAQARQLFPFPGEEDFLVRIFVTHADDVAGDEPEEDPDEDRAGDADDVDDFEDRTELRDFIPAPQLESIARRLVAERTEFTALRPVKLTYLWRREGGSAQGKPVLAKATPAPKLWRHQAGIDATVWLAADHGRALRLTYRQVEACLYHELLHLEQDKTGGFKRIGHDFEGFLKEFQAYGAWQQDLHEMAQLVRQTRLPGFDE